MSVRVRFAPSPTGLLHLGGLRTALFNYLYAAANNGKFILRIEDTDQSREVPGSLENIQNTFKWLGIKFDEGPSTGGRFAPYIQSQRLNIYQQYALDLIQRDKAYYCFCSKKRLESLRTQEGKGGGYDGLCRHLSSKQVHDKLQMGQPQVVRLKIPISGETGVNDLVYGNVQFNNSEIDDQVLLKSDGYPTYHLANVVDDHMMEISHVLRGEEWLPSTGKHVLIYKAFNWTLPVFVHLPLLMSSSGGKLSKRNQDVYVYKYKERGFRPEALLNFVALLGWSPKTNQEIFTMQELIENFNLQGINKSAAIVDEQRLSWLNSKHFQQQCEDANKMQEFVQELKHILLKHQNFNLSPDDDKLRSEYLSQIIIIIQERTSMIRNIPEQAPYFWIEPNLNRKTLLQIQNGDMILEKLVSYLSHCEFTNDNLSLVLQQFSDEQKLPYGKLMALVRHSITGGMPGPGLLQVMEVLGRNAVQQRLHKAMNTLRDRTRLIK